VLTTSAGVSHARLATATPQRSSATHANRFVVPAGRFDEIVRRSPEFARVLLSIVAERLRKMNRYL